MIKKTKDYLVESTLGNSIRISDKELSQFRWLEKEGDQLKFLYKNKVYQAQVLSLSADKKHAKIVLNNRVVELNLMDQLDQLISKMGLSDLTDQFTGELYSPMPGLVLNLMASVGDKVSKGDSILVLEAMKMENMIQAPADGVIQKISCKEGQTVNKGDLLVFIE